MSALVKAVSGGKHDDGSSGPESNNIADTEQDEIERNLRRESVEDIHIADDEKPSTGTELTRAPSNALSRVSSRFTTHSLPDPGPPPDGGLKAWTQIAMVSDSV